MSSKYQGKLPQTAKKLEEIPGIGKYTAGISCHVTITSDLIMPRHYHIKSHNHQRQISSCFQPAHVSWLYVCASVFVHICMLHSYLHSISHGFTHACTHSHSPTLTNSTGAIASIAFGEVTPLVGVCMWGGDSVHVHRGLACLNVVYRSIYPSLDTHIHT